jgi:hypothetical protein
MWNLFACNLGMSLVPEISTGYQVANLEVVLSNDEHIPVSGAGTSCLVEILVVVQPSGEWTFGVAPYSHLNREYRRTKFNFCVHRNLHILLVSRPAFISFHRKIMSTS